MSKQNKINYQLELAKKVIEKLNYTFVIKPYSILIHHPIKGKIEYYPKSDKLQIHKENTWLDNGLTELKNLNN